MYAAVSAALPAMFRTASFSKLHHWEPYPKPAPQQRLPSSLRMVDPAGPKARLIEPYARGDTLYGWIGKEKVGIPLQHVQGLERQQVNGLRTIGLIVGTTPALFTLSYYTGTMK